MAKAYMVTTYRSISKPDAVAAYAKLACSTLRRAIRPLFGGSSRLPSACVEALDALIASPGEAGR